MCSCTTTHTSLCGSIRPLTKVLKKRDSPGRFVPTATHFLHLDELFEVAVNPYLEPKPHPPSACALRFWPAAYHAELLDDATDAIPRGGTECDVHGRCCVVSVHVDRCPLALDDDDTPGAPGPRCAAGPVVPLHAYRPRAGAERGWPAAKLLDGDLIVAPHHHRRRDDAAAAAADLANARHIAVRGSLVAWRAWAAAVDRAQHEAVASRRWARGEQSDRRFRMWAGGWAKEEAAAVDYRSFDRARDLAAAWRAAYLHRLERATGRRGGGLDVYAHGVAVGVPEADDDDAEEEQEHAAYDDDEEEEEEYCHGSCCRPGPEPGDESFAPPPRREQDDDDSASTDGNYGSDVEGDDTEPASPSFGELLPRWADDLDRMLAAVLERYSFDDDDEADASDDGAYDADVSGPTTPSDDDDDESETDNGARLSSAPSSTSDESSVAGRNSPNVTTAESESSSGSTSPEPMSPNGSHVVRGGGSDGARKDPC